MVTAANPPVARPRYDLADLAIALITGLFLAMIALSLVTVPLAGKMVGFRDFVAYYATGRQLVHHADPYDAEAVRRIERDAGLPVHGVLLMRNPPWGLPLAYPLGLVNVRIAFVIWSALMLGCLLIPLYLIRQMHGSPPNAIHWLAFSFTPALMCLNMGQTSLFSLLGLALFLRYHRTHPFGAGAALWLCALKPHLFLPFFAALVAWILFTRTYRVVAGAAVAMAVSLALSYWIDPSAFPRYFALMRSPAVVQEFVPCLSDVLRFWIRPTAVWLQYLPAALASVWAVYYYWSRRYTWSWLENGSLLMLVSIVAAPYSYVYDQGVVIPAVVHGAYTTRARWTLLVLVGALALIGVEATLVKIISCWYLWTAPFWLAWYFVARAAKAPQKAELAPVPAQS
jgi:Glycosyltransferase family 87